ncbi:MerR family transcriptional regulator [bacterium]|nr:MerR family transcriptional regulator [bacterium]MBU1061883.1 MerR family transcriptional regulator [Candidatus Omnitrophota bacterium]
MTKIDSEIKKLYYSIGEVCKLTGLKSYVLRYWETEFRELRPPKNRAGNRTYRKKDIDTIIKIKELLYDKKFTIEGARNQLAITPQVSDTSDEGTTEKPAPIVINSSKEASILLEVRDQLKSILDKINS